MTTFLRLLAEKDKVQGIATICTALRSRNSEPRVFQVAPESFRNIPGSPFAYWVSEGLRTSFRRFPALESNGREARIGPSTGDDDRYVRACWEVPNAVRDNGRWVPLNKGGAASKFYFDYHLVIDWDDSRQTFRGFTGRPGRPIDRPNGLDHFFRPGITWPLRTQSGFNTRIVPQGLIFTHKGPTLFADDNNDLMALLGLTSSKAFELLVSIQISFGSYEVGAVQKAPVANLSEMDKSKLDQLARRAWSLKRNLDTVEETSHAFLLPAVLRPRLGDYNPSAIEADLASIQAEIDDIVFDLYGFSEADRAVAMSLRTSSASSDEGIQEANDDDVGTVAEPAAPPLDALLSWAVGVTFGRFDWRLAIAERQAPLDPSPFDPLPIKGPGNLPDGIAPFHDHHGILVDDPGHPHDLVHLVEDVLTRVDTDMPEDVRNWLQRAFFSFHLQRYSKSRRKAPIYWPLATTSGSYTLWVYYPALSSQTLYTAINDFIEPRLKQVSEGTTQLRNKGVGRSRAEEKELEELQAFELELIELRDTLLKLAPSYKPNHDDGVQVSAAPLWPLFRHKPWQKALKETWGDLEKGDYDWAHLAMNYWPERVREKCKSDKSLAIAHGLEAVFIQPVAKPKKPRARKNAGSEA